MKRNKSQLLIFSFHVPSLIVMYKCTSDIQYTSTEYESGRFLLTYCHCYRLRLSAWKLGRQSYNADGIGKGTLWLRNCYSVVGCTSPNIHTVPVSFCTVKYPVPSHSGQ